MSNSPSPTLGRRIAAICTTTLWASCLVFHSLQADEPAELGALRADRQTLAREFTSELNKLAERCDSLNLPKQAEATRRWPAPPAARRQVLFLPRAVDATAPAAAAPLVERQWHAKFLAIRQRRAAQLFELAQRTLRAGDAESAYRTLCEVLREDPDHAEARRVLALPARKTNASPAASSPAVDHPLTGWRRGQYWRVRTDHFVIATSHSAAVAQEAARHLEELHDVWRQMFFPFWSSGEALQARFEGRDESLGPKQQHQVVIFKNRDEYVAKLQASQPQIELTSGYYVDERKTVFLYAGDESTRPTWRHEVAHQLFQETLDVPAGVGERGNMWMVEGIATYLESLRVYNGYATVGGPDAQRLQFARYAGRRGAFLLPLLQLAPLTRSELQAHADIRAIYTQSTGLAHFLMDGEQGKWRSAAVAYLTAIYARRDTAQTLAERTGEPLEEMDRRYVEFLDVTDDDVTQFPDTPPLRLLSLGRTSVTDRGLAAIPAQNQLEWLDLSFTPVTDAGLARFRGSKSLKQLFLEETHITDQLLSWIGELKDLEELDLSGTKITDQGLARLSGLKKLRELYLARSQVTDRGLESLAGLKQLETLDLDATEVTAAGVGRLQQALPKWKTVE